MESNSDIQLYLLSEYMKSYIDVTTSFCRDSNKELWLYMKGSLAYQQLLLVQSLAEVSCALDINGLGNVFLDKNQCICDFKSFKQALLGELDFLKNKNLEWKPSPHNKMPEVMLNIILKK